jgi:hypothetical protein
VTCALEGAVLPRVTWSAIKSLIGNPAMIVGMIVRRFRQKQIKSISVNRNDRMCGGPSVSLSSRRGVKFD